MPALCRSCLAQFESGTRCPACRSPRVTSHPELFSLTVAHMDCDAFFASVEKRDNPDLADKAVIIGGGKRGVVSTACYLARIKGVKSAMPMFQALKLCPEAVVVHPRFDAYVTASRAIRGMMDELTPVVEPLSLDEAFMDLSGTARLHGAPPAVMLARLTKRMQDELGLTGSIGPTAQEHLNSAGIRTFADLLRWDRQDLAKRFGGMGDRLWHLARGQDARRVSAHAPVKGISNETTFFEDTSDPDILDGHIWRMAEKVSGRAKATDKAGRVIALKLKRANHTLISRRHSLRHPTQMADTIYRTARDMFDQVREPGPYRLLGVGLSDLTHASAADAEGDLLDPDAGKRAQAERAADAIRARFGADAILKGRALR